MQGASKQHVNAEEMLAELKRVLESSPRAPDVPPPSASMVSETSSFGPEALRPQTVEGNDDPIKATPDDRVKSGQPTDPHKSPMLTARTWKLTVGGLALAGAAITCARFALTDEAPSSPKRELVVATEGSVESQGGGTLAPPSNSNSSVQDSRQAASMQFGNLETHFDTYGEPTNGSPPPGTIAGGVDGPHPASQGSGEKSVAPEISPASASPAASPMVSKTAPVRKVLVRPDGTVIAAASPAPDSTDSTVPAEPSKPDAEAPPTASASTDSARASIPKIDSTKTPTGKTPPHRPAKIVKATANSAKPVAQEAGHSSQAALQNEAASSPQPAQGAGNPTAGAVAAATAIEQRFAAGMTHAFGYLMHLPSGLVPHSPDPNSDAN